MIKLIITDMDGTFLNSQGDYNRELFKDVITLMNEKGVKFAPCTGKQCERVEKLFGDEATNFWILGDSATRIKHKGDYLYQSSLKNDLGLQIIDPLESLDRRHIVIACTEKGAFIKSDSAPHLQQLVRSWFAKVNVVSSYSEIESDFLRITVYDEQGRCHDTKPHLSDFFDKAYIVVSEANWIDIAEFNVHKGSTVKKLQEILNITPEETVVFGDGLNDVELMKRGRFSFAMRNGCEETKAAANYITRSNDEDSVMRTIIQLLSR
ncbi:MAG: Cof-type HAD-IIB family hydrolase [Psychromonas sp.]|nr:Cof-type HAD-IIB family hydrolase [Psychromonas sp.]